MLIEQHAHHSILRERIIEHWLVAEIMRHLWNEGRTDIEVLRSEFDKGGYDLVLDLGGRTRHVQLKASRKLSTTREITVSLALAARPSGCVIWVVVNDDLTLDHFRWFGGSPGQSLPQVNDLPIAKHSKANALGVKAAKLNFRRVSSNRFVHVPNIPTLLSCLFGKDWLAGTAASQVD